MPTYLSLADIANEITRRAVPALFVDTCGTLDVVRCAARSQPRVAGIARQLLDAQAAGEVLLFAPSVLVKEAARNRVEVESDARRRAREIDAAIFAHWKVADTLGLPYPHTASFSHESLIVPLINLHDQLLAAFVHVTTEPSIESIALRRAGDNRRPARRGGGANDCLLFEEFRKVASAVPSADPLILLTTNTDDFGGDKGSSGGIHPEIAGDLIGTKARVCLSWDLVAAAVLTRARLKLI
jgi:hypothetical protein